MVADCFQVYLNIENVLFLQGIKKKTFKRPATKEQKKKNQHLR